MILLKISGLAKSVYYYTLSKNDKDDKNKEIIDKIKEIFINNKNKIILKTIIGDGYVLLFILFFYFFNNWLYL